MRFIALFVFLFLLPSTADATCSVGEALEYQFGPYTIDTRITVIDGAIIEFVHGAEPMPNQSQISTYIADCTKNSLRLKKIDDVKTYGESLWQDDFPGVTFGSAKLVRQSIVSMITGINTKAGIGLSESDMSEDIQNLNGVWQAGAADVAVLNNYTGSGSISAHDPTAWWP